MENALAVRENFGLAEIERMGAIIAKSNLFGIKTLEQAAALMLISQAEGRHPATVAQEYDIIQGRPALRSQAALIRFQSSGGKVQYLTRTDKEVSATFSHPQGSTITVSWDMARAHAMGLDTRDNWKKQPMIMLQWRCIAEGVRACFPACLSGQYLDMEVQDFEPAITPKPIKPLLDPAKAVKVEQNEKQEQPKEENNERLEAALCCPVAEEYLKSIKWWPLTDALKAKIETNLDNFERAMGIFADKKVAGVK